MEVGQVRQRRLSDDIVLQLEALILEGKDEMYVAAQKLALERFYSRIGVPAVSAMYSRARSSAAGSLS